MGNATLDYIYEQLKALEIKVAEAEELLNFSRQAGNDVSKQVAILMTNKQKMNSYRTALKGKGYDI